MSVSPVRNTRLIEFSCGDSNQTVPRCIQHHSKEWTGREGQKRTRTLAPRENAMLDSQFALGRLSAGINLGNRFA